MSYYISDQHDQRRSRTPLLVVAVLTVIALIVGAVLLARPADAPRAGEAPLQAAPPLQWEMVGSQPVPHSAWFGPRETAGGRARGFTHDELGAVLAAIQISARLSPELPPAVFEATAREQCVGDIDGVLSQIRGARSDAAPDSTVPEEFFYRISRGDPEGDVVGVSLAVSSPQGRAYGGFVGAIRTLQWVDGDWKLLLPGLPAQVIASVDSYQSLGRPDV